jgi:hypothetical protein
MMAHKMKMVNILISSMMFLVGCDENRAEVFPLDDLSYVEEMETYSQDKYTIKNELFVIANIPSDQQDIKAIIEKYNSETLSDQELKKYFGWLRMFYRETPDTPRDYKENNRGYFEHDRLEFHGKDLVLIVKWTEFGKNVEYLFQNDK